MTVLNDKRPFPSGRILDRKKVKRQTDLLLKVQKAQTSFIVQLVL
jgi:hypothetical protein